MASKWIQRILTIIAFVGTMVSGTEEGAAASQPAPAPKTAAAPHDQKATWLWKTEWIRRDPQEVLTFLTRHEVNLVYLQINADIPVTYYKSFIKQSAALGIEVDALNGAPRWGLTSNRQEITGFLNWVKSYQQAAGENEAFHGIHVDIEPHLLPEWKEDLPDVIRQWESNVRYLRNEADRMGLPLSADIPFWLGNYTASDGKTALNRFMIGQFDSVTVMSYRNTAKGINDIAQSTLKAAADLGKAAMAAVETKPSLEGDFITFYQEGAEVMYDQMAELQDMLKDNPAYAGIAIHDFDGWRDLKN
ncbi:hypothetical protein RJP21_03870 [Paenibacillus sp. VCA1]|uniref:hypothetical protein n=1 Tax=Paenibacillus sp. VCA1 TaxID=3039148 RepID=UPI002871767A|nr:hypothetical protein [Paenibacillus sp. VCA1]MDR9852741.1 hypothetical protein [Paenibacillus sp. VCA1]